MPIAKALPLVVLCVAWSLPRCVRAESTETNPDVTITSLAALAERVGAEPRSVASVQIEGVVWWSSTTEGRVILHDDTATLQLELDLPCAMPRLGDVLTLQGGCVAIRSRDAIKLCPVPVVENGGMHAMVEQSGNIHLQSGRHPVRVDWFNRTDRFGLDVDYEGPDLPRQQIPDAVLFRTQVDEASGATNFVQGLDYRCCEGQWWRQLPNFDHMAAVQTGVAGNFDIEKRSRDNHVGLQFTGFIDIPRDGEYTFHVQSDDGSRLFIGEPSLRIGFHGRSALPSPHPVAMEEVAGEEPEYQWSSIDGVVTSVHRPQGALELELMTELGLVRVKVAEDSDRSYTLRPQNRIRAVGASRRIHNLDGLWMRGEFFVQRWDDLDQRYISPTIWTEYPLVKIGSLVPEDSGDLQPVVRLGGEVVSDGSGKTAMLQDGTGQVVLADGGWETHVGHTSEVLGRLSFDGPRRVLRHVLFRQVGSVGTEPNNLPLLTTVDQIYQLSLEEAAKGYPVRVRGVITSPMESDGAVLQDSSRGIYVVLGGPVNLQTGDFCEIEGVTGPYQFSQYIAASRVDVLGTGALPEPVQPTWDQLINGSLHCNYVELEGVVASIDDDTIALLTRGGRINVRLNATGPALPGNALGATLRLRGCLLADWEGDTHRVAVGSIYLDQHWVAVIHPAPIDPFAIPLKHVGDLLQFDPQAGALQRVKVSGQLVYRDEEMCCLMDGRNGLRFMPVDADAAQVGDRVEVVGFLELGGPSSVLREALVRSTGHAEMPAPRKLDAHNLVRDEYDSTRVQLNGVLLGVSEKPDKVVLEMQNGLLRFVAELAGQSHLESDLTPGSRLQLTGVYIGQGGNRVLARRIDSFRLMLGSGRDIRVLSRPSWLTLTRLLIVLGILAAILVAALVWIKLLSRTVEERTRQLGDQIRKRQRAERQREVEQERARVAHDLHDDLGAGLTEVNMLAALVKSQATSPEEKARYANELNELALRMVTSLDEIVWAVNPRNDTVTSLAGYFGAYAQRLLELASVGCGLDVAEDLPDHPLDPRFRQELFLAFKEALTNVVQHAEATKVWVRIAVKAGELVVVVSDDGRGILSEKREAGADGLINIRQRLSALGGHCEIQSEPGEGTTVRFQVPIQKELP